MQSAELDQTGVDIGDAADSVTLRANGQVIALDGFMSVYRESKDAADDREKSADGNRGQRHRWCHSAGNVQGRGAGDP